MTTPSNSSNHNSSKRNQKSSSDPKQSSSAEPQPSPSISISIGQTLKGQGYKGIQLFESIATRTVHLKEQSRTHRCQRCWHDAATRCICAHIPPLVSDTVSDSDSDTSSGSGSGSGSPELKNKLLPIKVMILMHYKEYLSAGNDAKLILALLPNNKDYEDDDSASASASAYPSPELYIFGKEGEWDRFEAECTIDPSHTVILWPAEDALTVEEWMEEKLSSDSPWRQQKQKQKQTQEQPPASTLPTLRVIVLDGVYSQARSMYRTLQRRFPLGHPTPASTSTSIPIPIPPHVALHPTTLSVYHRAHKSYSHSSATTVQKSNNPDALHICTVEAVALLMQELGEAEEVTKALVRSVEINNLALVHSLDVRPPPSTSLLSSSSSSPSPSLPPKRASTGEIEKS